MNFLEKYIVRKLLRFLNKAVEVETRLPCKVSETQLIYYFRNFWVCPG